MVSKSVRNSTVFMGIAALLVTLLLIYSLTQKDEEVADSPQAERATRNTIEQSVKIPNTSAEQSVSIE